MNGTGFFLYDSLNGNKFLITNYHVISRDIVNLNTSIEIEIFDGKKFDIELNKNAPNIKFFEKPIDITTIQINDLKEICNSIQFLEIDLNYKKGYNIYVNNDVFILGYPFGNSVECSPGKIIQISEFKFCHNCDTNNGSSGSPIILASNLTVIGIHLGGREDIKINFGTFLGIIFEKSNNYRNEKRNDSKNSNNKIIKNNNYSIITIIYGEKQTIISLEKEKTLYDLIDLYYYSNKREINSNNSKNHIFIYKEKKINFNTNQTIREYFDNSNDIIIKVFEKINADFQDINIKVTFQDIEEKKILLQ